MTGDMAVTSQGDILLFTENNRLYCGLQLKAVVSYTDLLPACLTIAADQLKFSYTVAHPAVDSGMGSITNIFGSQHRVT